MLIGLALNYNHDLNKTKLEALVDLSEKAFGFDHDWELVTVKIAANETFFPNIAVIKKYLRPTPGLESNESKATACVDRFIAYLSGAIERKDLSEHDLLYCRKKFNVDRFSFARGQVNLDFKRREWIEMVKNDFDYGTSCEPMRIEAPRVLELINKSTKEF